MKLTDKEKALLDGKHGLGLKKAMEILVALGQIYDAKEMVAVTSAQIAGVSYKNIGDHGLTFLKDYSSDFDLHALSHRNCSSKRRTYRLE